MSESCGGHYCKHCLKCTKAPRKRKTYTPDYWHICEECDEEVLQVSFIP